MHMQGHISFHFAYIAHMQIPTICHPERVSLIVTVPGRRQLLLLLLFGALKMAPRLERPAANQRQNFKCPILLEFNEIKQAILWSINLEITARQRQL